MKAKGPCITFIGNIEGSLFVCVVSHFQGQAELTELSSFLNHRIFVLTSRRIRVRRITLLYFLVNFLCTSP